MARAGDPAVVLCELGPVEAVAPTGAGSRQLS